MRQRCSNSNCIRYSRYGGRGITVCDEWNDFNCFYKWAIATGYKDDLTIDRINTDGNYEPSNCRWVTQKVQQNNRSNNRHITINGVTRTVAEWAGFLNVNAKNIYAHLEKGSAERYILSHLQQ
jgi:hypothetical protein